MTVTILNKVNYTDQEFSTASARIRNFLEAEYPDVFNDLSNSNLGNALIDIIAYAEQNMMWYMNRKITDMYFPTARTPNSVSKLARMLGYKSQGATSAEVTVSINLDNGPYTFPVQIDTGFEFQGPNNQVWEYRGEVPIVYSPGETSKSGIVLSQGQTVTNNFVSNGLNNQVFELLSVAAGKFVEASSVKVVVDGEEWTEQNAIPFSNEQNYETNLLASPPFIKFGDGVQGVVPPEGSAIEVNYVVNDGFLGRIVSNSITGPVNGLIAQFEDIAITVSQLSGSVGGDDPEDLRSIRTSAPLFQRTQNRAITKGDYDFLGNQFENVARSDAQIIRGVSGDITFNAIAQSIYDTVSGAEQGISTGIAPLIDSFEAQVSGLYNQVDIFGSAAKSSIDDEISSVSGRVENIETITNDALTTLRSDVGLTFSDINGFVVDISNESLSLIDDISIAVDVKNSTISNLLDSIESAVSGTASEATVDSLVALIRAKISETRAEVVSAATTTNSLISSENDNIKSSLLIGAAQIEAVSGTIATNVQPEQDLIAADMVSMCESISGAVSGFDASVSGFVAQIQSDVAAIDEVFVQSTSGLLETVSGQVTDFIAHADEHLSESCDANKVQVKILGKDANRKYVPPLETTKAELKAFLEERKDITHTVDVVSGDSDILEADVVITVRVSDNAVEDDVIAEIRDALEKSDVTPFGLLVEREFSSPLFVWDIDGAIRESVTDSENSIEYLNIKIEQPSEYLDDAGNLISPVGSVIQAGTITINKLPRFTRDGT